MTSWISSGVTPQTLERALARLEAGFLGTPGAEALVARREAGGPASKDGRAAVAHVKAVVEAQEEDGSWRGSLVATVESLLLLRELLGAERPAAVDGAVARGLAWLRRLRGGPGRYGDGCSPERHRLGVCHHAVGGFFAPAPPLATGEELVLPCGARFPAGSAARLAASCTALRVCLRWGVFGPDTELHLDGLRRLLELDPRGANGLVPLEALPAVLVTLLEVPDRPELSEVTARGISRLTQMQRADGSWPELDALYILEALLAAADAGFGGPAIDAAIRRGAGLLAVTQRQDGQWERNATARRSLIGWRALRHAVRIDAGATQPAKGGD